MPALPEVETTCRGISPHIVGRCVDSVQIRHYQLRWPIPKNLPDLVSGQCVKEVARRAKYILIRFDTGTLLIHLGMSGSLRIVDKNSPIKKHDHVDIGFSHGVYLRYHDPRRFGAVLWLEDERNEALLGHLGPEPWDQTFDANYLFQRSRGKQVSVKSFIMDGRQVVGVGNIYASEALFAAGINPQREAGRISRKRYERLVIHIRRVLEEAIAQGGTTLKDFVNSDGQPGYFVQQLKVYGRAEEPCVCCGGQIQQVRLNNRSTFFCRRCQR